MNRTLVLACAVTSGLWIFGLACHGQKPAAKKAQPEKPAFVWGDQCFIDMKTGKDFACENRAGAIRISAGYTAEQAMGLMRDREMNAWEQFKKLGDTYESFIFLTMRARDAKSEYSRSPRVHDVASVTVSKTQDTEFYVIRMSATNGRTISLWLEGGTEGLPFKVRSRTEY